MNLKPFYWITGYKRLLATIQELILEPITTLGPFLVAGMPALFIGLSVYHWAVSVGVFSPSVALIISLGFAMAVETANIVIIHKALALYDSNHVWRCGILSVISIIEMSLMSSIIASGEVGLPETLHLVAKLSPFLTGAVYLALALARSAQGFEEAEHSKVEYERQKELEALDRQRQIEDEERQHRQELERLKLEAQNEAKLIKAEVQKAAQSVQKAAHLGQMSRSKKVLNQANDTRQKKKVNRQNAIIEIVNIEPDIGPTELTKRLNDRGHEASVSTVKRDMKALNGKLQEIR